MLWCRGLDRGRRGVRAPADVLPVRPADVRSGQARTAMGPGDVGRATGTRMPDVPGGPAGLGRAARPVRVLWSYAAFCDARTGRVPRVRPRPRRAGRARVDGRLAQRESASLTRKRSGVRTPQRPPERLHPGRSTIERLGAHVEAQRRPPRSVRPLPRSLATLVRPWSEPLSPRCRAHA